MKTTAFKVIIYALKIWLTCVFVVPLLFQIGMSISDTNTNGHPPFIWEFISEYNFFLIIEFVCSALTWLVFTLIIAGITLLEIRPFTRTLIVCVASIALTYGTFAFVFGFPTMDKDIVGLMLLHCAIIGGGVWFYKLNLPET